MLTTTEDTNEQISVIGLPPNTDRRGYQLDGYDWMATLPARQWYSLANWGVDGYDAGSWPYVIFATTHQSAPDGSVYGFGTYVEGDLSQKFYRTQAAMWEAITAEVFWYWKHGQSDGPKDLPDDVGQLAREFTVPYGHKITA